MSVSGMAMKTATTTQCQTEKLPMKDLPFVVGLAIGPPD